MALANNKKSLIIAAASAFVVFIMFAIIALPNTKQQQPKQVAPKYQYVITKNEIKSGAAVKEEDVEIKEYPINIPNAYKATGEVVGRKTKVKIDAGKPVMKSFIKEIIVKDKEEPKVYLPDEGFRAFPMLVRKNDFPSFVVINKRFDIYSRENSMKLENVRVLNLIENAKDSATKMLVLEIKESDLKSFIKYMGETKGLIFLQKNPGDIGEYNFIDIAELDRKEKELKEQREWELTLKRHRELQEANRELPPVQTISNSEVPNIEDLASIDEPKVKQVEVIVGSTKSTVDFKETNE